MIALDDLKRYARIDYDDDDDLIAGLGAAWETYLKGAGIHQRGEDDSVYRLLVQAMTLHSYEFRTVSPDALPLGLRRMINQRKAEEAGQDAQM